MPEKEEKSKRGDGVRCRAAFVRELGRGVDGGPWFDLREGEGDGSGVAVGGEGVDPGAAGIAEAEELGDFVVGFAGGVVDGAADDAVVPGCRFARLAGEIEVGVAAGDDEGEGGNRTSDGEPSSWGPGVGCFHQDGVDVAFEVVDGDEGLVEAEGEGFGVGDADEEGAGEAGAVGDGDGVEVGEGDTWPWQGGADDGDDGAEVLAGGEFGDDSAVVGVEGDLRGDDVGEGFGAARGRRRRRSRRRRIRCRG